MKKQYFLYIFVGVCLCLTAISCAPTTFVQTMSPSWNTVEVREGLAYDDAWNSVVDLISKEFDIEIISKEDGYLRTGWLFTWTGKLENSYKVRAIIKFSPDGKQVEIKSDAQFYSGGFFGIGQGWVMGMDERLITTLRTDIMGKIGRVTR